MFLILLILSACGSDETLNPETTNGEIPTPLVVEEENTEGSEEEEQLEEELDFALKYFKIPSKGTRPYAVMIDNAGSRVLPQGGLNLAQVVYEIIVEGGETRFMCLFWDQEPSMIGSVRSSRHYFLDYSMEHDAVYVHIGWSPMAERDIPKFGINNINGAWGVFWDITDDPYNWQDSYTSMEKIKSYVEKVGFRTVTENDPVFSYSDRPVLLERGQKAEKINLKYSWVMSAGYKYDEEKGVYFRYRKDEPHMERVSEEQIFAKNIIIQLVRNYPIQGDSSGRQEVDTVGSGNGYYITNGKYIEITWSKPGRKDKTQYFDKEGNSILLNPGQTWVQIFPTNGSLEIE